MITCGWCGTHYATWQNRCDSCGGAMPPMPGHELGEGPDDAPRHIPPTFARRTRFTRNIMVILGSAFFVIGAIMTCSLIASRSWGGLLTLLFVYIGAYMFRVGWREASNTLRAF